MELEVRLIPEIKIAIVIVQSSIREEIIFKVYLKASWKSHEYSFYWWPAVVV